MGAAVFEISVTGDDEQAFQTSFPASLLKSKSLRDHLLVPFIQQVRHNKGTQLACSYVEVNGLAVPTAELRRPLVDFVSDPEVTRVEITLELINTPRGGTSKSLLPAAPTRSRPNIHQYAAVVDEVAWREPQVEGVQLGTAAASMRAPTSLEATMGTNLKGSASSGSRFFFGEPDKI